MNIEMDLYRRVDSDKLCKEMLLTETEMVRGEKSLTFQAQQNAKAFALALFDRDAACELILRCLRQWYEENGIKWEDVGKPLDAKA